MPKKNETKKNETKKFASVNWSLMNESFNLLSSCQLSVNELAQAEKDLKQAKDKVKDKSKEEIKRATEKERLVKKNAFDRANGLAIAFITRYVSTEDVLHGNIYNFNMTDFLKNIGVLTDGEIDKKVIDRVNDYRKMVVNREKIGVTKRKNCTNKLTIGEIKEVKNTPIELVLSIIMCAINSGAIEYSQGGLAKKKFD